MLKHIANYRQAKLKTAKKPWAVNINQPMLGFEQHTRLRNKAETRLQVLERMAAIMNIGKTKSGIIRMFHRRACEKYL